jgi:hypothetical protein
VVSRPCGGTVADDVLYSLRYVNDALSPVNSRNQLLETLAKLDEGG